MTKYNFRKFINMVTSKYVKLVKPLKRSKKVRLRKELERREKEAQQNNNKLTGNKWEYKI